MPRGPSEPTDRKPVIAIIGLEAIGLALGKSLQAVKTRYSVEGHDRDPERVRAALGAGAIDRGQWSVAELAAGADLIFLTETGGEGIETLAVIAPQLRPGTLVTSTGPAMEPAGRRAAELLPPSVSFIAGHPIPRASDTPLQGATYCLAPSPTASDEAVRVLHALVARIGAAPFYIDAAEHDGLAAAVGGLPQVLGIALLRALARSPSERDLRRLAGPALHALVDAALSEGAAGHLPTTAVGAEERTAWATGLASWLDQVIAELAELRALVAAGDGEGLAELARQVESTWAAWQAPEPEAGTPDPFEEARGGTSLGSLLFGRWRLPGR